MTRRRLLIGFAAAYGTARWSRAAAILVPIDEQGFRQMLAAHRGHPVLVDFWATWCAPCREELPKLVSLYSAYRGRGLDFVTISCDEPEQQAQAAAFIDKQGAPAPRYIRRAADDDKFINAIDPKWSGALPALFLFDRNGKQVNSFIGETDMRQLELSIKRLLAG